MVKCPFNKIKIKTTLSSRETVPLNVGKVPLFLGLRIFPQQGCERKRESHRFAYRVLCQLQICIERKKCAAFFQPESANQLHGNAAQDTFGGIPAHAWPTVHYSMYSLCNALPMCYAYIISTLHTVHIDINTSLLRTFRKI